MEVRDRFGSELASSWALAVRFSARNGGPTSTLLASNFGLGLKKTITNYSNSAMKC